jgi:hypothetical protein
MVASTHGYSITEAVQPAGERKFLCEKVKLPQLQNQENKVFLLANIVPDSSSRVGKTKHIQSYASEHGAGGSFGIGYWFLH